MPGLLLEKVDSTLDVPTDCILRLPDEILQYILTIDHRDWITWCPYLTEDDWTKQRLQYNPDPCPPEITEGTPTTRELTEFRNTAVFYVCRRFQRIATDIFYQNTPFGFTCPYSLESFSDVQFCYKRLESFRYIHIELDLVNTDPYGLVNTDPHGLAWLEYFPDLSYCFPNLVSLTIRFTQFSSRFSGGQFAEWDPRRDNQGVRSKFSSMLELLKEKLKGVTFDVELENFQIGEQFELAEGIGKDHSLYKRLMAKKEEAEKSPWWIERFRANPTKWLDYVAL